ncbi:hypothetical protein BASA81_005650 [Batrachochytrium salamandrivorans]|nr:hypothetical protein BASA81_005650 [Batrachochytrium salamandrivorans]
MSKLRANSEASSSSSICTDDDVVQKRKKRGVRGMLSMNQEDDYSDQSSNESSSKNSFTDEDEFGEHEEVENLFDETFEELCILEAKQLRANAAAAIDAANQKNPTSQRTLDVLRTVPFFAQFSLEHQEQLFSELQEESFTDGVNIVSQGELGDKFYVIVQGEAVVSKMDEFGEFRDLTHILLEISLGNWY